MTPVAALLLVLLVLALPRAAGADTGQLPRTVVPHLDGSGGATIIEVDPDVPGAKRILEASPEPIPGRGELILPARATATPRPTPSSRHTEAEAGPFSPGGDPRPR